MTDHEYDPGMATLSAIERIARLAGFTGALETLPRFLANQIDAARSAQELLKSTEVELRNARKAALDATDRAAQLEVELSAEKRSRVFVEAERDAARAELRALHRKHLED